LGVLPVLVVRDVAHAEPLARALAAGGVTAAEITLRSPASLEVITAMRAAAPDLWVGAGTVLSAEDAAAAREAGAQFLISPGTTAALARALKESGLPSIPGIATASEAMARAEEGFTLMKFFPAERAGGPAALKDMHGPLPKLRFCPTGGITPDKVEAYLACPNVVCVGGSWIAPEALMDAGDWAAVEANARRASGFARP
jgi:2-dehydro-3-deoxyphosphogluconate aldolase/(4S)-4-hydroxy-2-oxoglutarate aldolase